MPDSLRRCPACGEPFRPRGVRGWDEHACPPAPRRAAGPLTDEEMELPLWGRERRLRALEDQEDKPHRA